jgi:hypothetical protein
LIVLPDFKRAFNGDSMSSGMLDSRESSSFPV